MQEDCHSVVLSAGRAENFKPGRLRQCARLLTVLNNKQIGYDLLEKFKRDGVNFTSMRGYNCKALCAGLTFGIPFVSLE